MLTVNYRKKDIMRAQNINCIRKNVRVQSSQWTLILALVVSLYAPIEAWAQTVEVSAETKLQALDLMKLGQSAADKGNHQSAIEYFTQTIALNPNDATAYYNRGVLYGKLDEPSSAISDFTQAIDLNPALAVAYYNRGVSYTALNDYLSAISDYTQAIALNPNYVEAYNNRGILYRNLNDHSSAIRDYTQAIALNPNYADAYNNRGIEFVQQKNYRSATRDARKVCSLGNCKILELLSKNGWIRD